MNHSSENLKVIYTKCSMFYAIVNYQFKTSELKNDGEANSSSLIRIDWECAFYTICEIIFLVGVP